MKKGLFITFEGPEGSGKSTICNEIYKWLSDLIKDNKINYSQVLKTREPGGNNNKLCESIRQLILSDDYALSPLTETLLLAAARSHHLTTTILPALDNNQIVLCDRFIDSSYVYQGLSTNIGIDTVISINKIATSNILPDLTLILMVDAEIGLNRIKTNNRETNKIDLRPIEYHKQIENNYLKLKQFDSKNRIRYINANINSIDTILNNCKEEILKYIYGIK